MKILIILFFIALSNNSYSNEKNYLISKQDKYCSFSGEIEKLPRLSLFDKCFDGYNLDVTVINQDKSIHRFRTTNIFMSAILKMYCNFDKEIITKFPTNDNYDGFISCIYKKK